MTALRHGSGLLMYRDVKRRYPSKIEPAACNGIKIRFKQNLKNLPNGGKRSFAFYWSM